MASSPLTKQVQKAIEGGADQGKIIERLLLKIDHMTKKTERSSFALVLIDGDGMIFLDSLVAKGIPGGEEASSLLRAAVHKELRHDTDYKYDQDIMIKVYANIRGLSKAYYENGHLSKAEDFADFMLGFNKSHPLCDFIDAGNHKEAADRKLQETFKLNIHNVHCQQIIFGGPTDNGHASFLRSFFEEDVAGKVRLLKGPGFAREFSNILPRFKQTDFPKVFMDRKMEPTHGHMDFGFGVTRPRRSPEASDRGKQSPPRPLHKLLPAQRVLLPSVARPGYPYPSSDEIDIALITWTYAILAETPVYCDFGKIRSRAAETLGKPMDFFNGREMQHKSSVVMKWAAEEWILHTNSAPPKNATWLLNRSPGATDPASLVLTESAKIWRTIAKEHWASVPIGQAAIPTNAGARAGREMTRYEPTSPDKLSALETALDAGGEGIKRGPSSPLESPRVRMPPPSDTGPSNPLGENVRLGAVGE